MEQKRRCRICLTKSDSHIDIFVDFLGENKSNTYAESIRHIATVDCRPGDGLPPKICFECCAEIENIFKFGQLIRHGDEILRKELEEKKALQAAAAVEDENVEIFEEGDFMPGAEEVDMHMYVLEEEVLEGEIHGGEIIVEEFVKHGHEDVDELQMVEEILEVDDDVPELKQEHLHHDEDLVKNVIKSDPLAELAQVAATQQNVHVDQQHFDHDDTAFYVEDECDDNYLIPHNPADEPFYNFKPPKWKCVECKQILRGDVSYEGHMNIHKQLRPHKCPECRCQFRCRKALKKHKELRHINIPAIIQNHQVNDEANSKKYFQCMDCGEECQSKEECLLHYLLLHDNRSDVKTCPFCPNSKVDNLVEHLQYVHVHEEKSANNDNEVVHSVTTASASSRHCKICSQTFISSQDLHYHSKLCAATTEEDDEYDDAITIDDCEENLLDCVDAIVHCDVCKKKLLKKNLGKHMCLHQRKNKKSDVDNTKFLCAYCPREFKYSKSLHQHEKTHKGESADTVYVCGDCSRQYTSQFLLETHRKQAHKERDHVCSICGNAFKLKNQLVNHMKLHLEKNIQCPHCDKKYARQFDLNVHLRSHTGEMPYACHLCSKRFAIKVRLTYHLQKHYGIKHQCKECHAEFNSKQKLKAHSFKHTGMPYRCELCDDHGFSTRVVFKRHLNRVHNATMSDEALNEMFQRNTGKTIKIKQINEEPPEDVD